MSTLVRPWAGGEDNKRVFEINDDELHCLLLGGIHRSSAGEPVFQEARAPITAESQGLLARIITRMMRVLILFASR